MECIEKVTVTAAAVLNEFCYKLPMIELEDDDDNKL